MKSTGLKCYAVTAPGLAPLVVAELAALGIFARADDGGAGWEGDIASVYRANLWLRTATRVLVRVARFRATSFWELERRAAAIPWTSVVRPGTAVAFRVTARKSKLYHSDAIAERLAKSVIEKVRGVQVAGAGDDDESEDGSATPTGAAAPGGAVQLFVVRISRDELTLSADSSGEPLYRRGYRQAVARAPLRETLAAAILLGSGWEADEPLLDPFCGSGTIPLEAALMAGRIAPALARASREPRDFGFLRWPGFDGSLWQKCVDDARMMIRELSPGRIAGADRDAGAIAAARANAARAGLAEVIGFAEAPVSSLAPPEGHAGWVATNPPYGMRIGDQADVRRLYAAFGRAARERAPGWGLAMLSPDRRLDGITASEWGSPLKERFQTRNGGIPVSLVSGEG